ncbi:hypothetical protein JCM10213_004615 [Rhodosporidiobolus nylandii]
MTGASHEAHSLLHHLEAGGGGPMSAGGAGADRDDGEGAHHHEFHMKTVQRIVTRIQALTLELLPIQVDLNELTSPTSSVLTKDVVEAYSVIGGDFAACLPFALLEARRYFREQQRLNPSDADKNAGRKLACEAIARKIPPEVVPLSTKPWSLLLSLSSSSSSSASASPSWLAIGHTGTSPLSLLPLTPSGPLPSAMQPLARTRKTTSVYALASPPPSSPLSPSHTVIAAFYDSTTRVFALRVPLPPASPSSWDDDFRPANEIARLPTTRPTTPPTPSPAAVPSAAPSSSRPRGTPPCGSSTSAPSPALPRSQPMHQGGTAPLSIRSAEGSRVYGATESRGFVLDWDPWQERGAEGVAFVRHSEGGAMRWSDGRGV